MDDSTTSGNTNAGVAGEGNGARKRRGSGGSIITRSRWTKWFFFSRRRTSGGKKGEASAVENTCADFTLVDEERKEAAGIVAKEGPHPPGVELQRGDGGGETAAVAAAGEDNTWETIQHPSQQEQEAAD